MIQVIVYSIATGRVRRVVDPEIVTPNVITYLNQVTITPGEARLVYNKVGGGADTLLAWQTAVNAHTLLNPDTAKTDWYCGVNVLNAIQWWGLCDPLCGDGVAGLTLVNAPWGADSTWTYNGLVFTAPAVVKGLGK